MTSFVQVRGSIPLFWYQQPNPMKPKPDIIFQSDADPDYRATRRHFAQLFRKFGWPVTCINLTKKKMSKENRELEVAAEYRRAVEDRINLELPEALRITFVHYDVKAKKKEEP